jgi:hypothetical protein
MPEGGKVTPISPGIVRRVTQAARFVISGVPPDAWFGPMQPLPPMAPADVKGRAWDYPTGINLNYTPRGDEGISFADMRGLAENCDVLRAVIETRKDQLEALDWSVKVKTMDSDSKRVTATRDQQKRIDKITAFMESPDQERPFDQWMRMLLDEDMFVIDAASVYRWPDRKGDLYALRIIDGARIKPLINNYGFRPSPPDPAYQEVLKGVPAIDYTSDELLYLMRNPRSHKLYGYSHVEQIIITVNTAIRRALSQLEYYREGSQPDAFVGLPKEWTQDQITTFQKFWDGMMSGNLGQRRHLKFLPGEFKYQATKEPVLKDEYDDYLTRVICFVFSTAPTALVKANNRSVADNQHDQAREEGLAPLQKFVRRFWNRIIAEDFESPDLVFDYQDDREMDPQAAAVIRKSDVDSGIISIDEARDSIGLDALGGAYAVPMALTPNGYVAIKSPEEQDADAQAQQQVQQAAAEARAKQMQNGQPNEEHGGGAEGKPNPKQNKANPKDDATKLAKAVKKKPNPYLLTTVHRHGSHARA